MEAKPTNKYDVFISYSRKDNKIADQICTSFDKAGITYFIDRQGIAGGGHFPAILADAIVDSELFLFLGSKNSYKSPYVDKEVNYANQEKQGKIIPYILDDSEMKRSLKFMFSNVNCLKMKEHPIEPALVTEILALLGRNNVVVPIPSKKDIITQRAKSFFKTNSNLGNVFGKLGKNFWQHLSEKPVVSILMAGQLVALSYLLFLAIKTITFGYIANPPHAQGWWSSFAIIVACILEMIATVRIFLNKKKAFYTVFILDAVILIAMVILSCHIYKHGKHGAYYINWLHDIGASLKKNSIDQVIYAFLAPIHWAIMRVTLMIKHKKVSAWKLLK